MTDNDKCCPPPIEVQDFLFKQASIGQICEEFGGIPLGSSLIAVDGKRGLLYIGHDKKLIIVKPGNDGNPEWKLELDLLAKISRVALSCDYSFVAVTFVGACAFIYDASSIHKHTLDKLHEIRLSTSSGNITVSDLKWNPAIPDMFCSIASDHTIGCFQVSKDRKTGVQILGMECPQGLEAMCVSWSPKGKQLVIGSKKGDIVQLKPDLKVARQLIGPNPSEGVIISILWVSNYQFCACYYRAEESRISVMVADAPKGATTPKFTNYEDVTFGTGSMEGLIYYFEHIAEWGIIIAASTHSSEVAVLGTSDNGTTWNQWQLMDDSTAQLPMNRKMKTENFPVGIAVDKSSTQKLPWGTESTLPNPVPVLRILVTSGQLCCYHMVNLRNNPAAICSPPTENVPAPKLPRPSIGPSEVSFNMHAGITSTPRPKPVETIIEKPKANKIGENANSNAFSFLGPASKGTAELVPQSELKNIGFSAPTEMKSSALFGQGDNKISFFSQENKFQSKPAFVPQPEPIKQPIPSLAQPMVQPELKNTGFAVKVPEFKSPAVPLASQADNKQKKEPVREQQEVGKPGGKETPVYDDGLCMYAYYEEQARFEKELKARLDLPTWHCGTDEERELLVRKSGELEDFLRELRETTNSLASDIAYLKALLLQSFAWIEESKSKSSANVSITGRNRSDGNKLADLQRLYYYTQSQLIQATKVLDLEWAEHHSRELAKMKIPSLEVIYQSLIRYNQIVAQERKNLDELSKKWRTIGRGGGGGGGGVANGGNSSFNLDRSMSNLSLSQVNDTAIEQRCKLIANNTRNFSREKQARLRDLLSESAPRTIRAVRPTAVQDRLEAKLSQLASLKTTEAATKARISKNAQEQQKSTVTEPVKPLSEPAKLKAQMHNPLSSLDNLVSGIGGSANPMAALSKSPSSNAPFFSGKPTATFAKPKENTPLQFGQDAGKTAISFGGPPKTPEKQIGQQGKPLGGETPTGKLSSFPSFGKLGSPESLPTSPLTTSAPLPSIVTQPVASFSFSLSSTSPPGYPAMPKFDTATAFKFSSKTPLTPAQPTSAPVQGSLDLSNFSSRPGLTITPTTSATTEAKAAPAITAVTSAMTTFTFGKTPTTQPQLRQPYAQLATAGAGSLASGNQLGTLFGKSTGTAPVVSTAVAASSAPASTQAAASPSLNSTAAPSSTVAAATTSATSIFGTSSLAAGLSAAATPIFGSAPASTPSSTTSAASPATTAAASTPSISFGANTAATSATGFGSILGATAALSFGTPTAATAISPAFGSKTGTAPATNIFGGTGGASTPSTGFSLFGKSDASAPAASAATTASPFGTAATSAPATTTASPFGTAATSAPATTVASPFGTAATSAPTTTTASPFGTAATSAPASNTATTTTSVFGTPSSTSVFGGQATATTTASTENSFFSAKPTATTATPTSSIFGGATTAAPSGSIFGSSGAVAPAFGATTTTQSNVFGTSSATQSSGTSVFGNASTPATGSVFGSTSSPLAAPVFGAASTASTTASTSVFGSSTLAATGSLFGGGGAAASPAGTSVFGTSAAPTSSIFGGGAATTSSSMFGTAAAATTTAVTTPPSGSIFGGAAQPAGGSVFGAASTGASTGGSMFGAPAALGGGTSMFGGAASPGGMAAGNVFGQASTFGSKPVFGSPTSPMGGTTAFGSTGFGSPPAFGSAPAAGFGSPSAIGAGAPLGSTSPSKVFGSSTFEALGAQTGGLSFGSLAQKTTEPEKAQFQGSSSFSSWR